MWLAKWFGRRDKARQEEYEPATHPPVTAASNPRGSPNPARAAADDARSTPGEKQGEKPGPAPSSQGFDPYNSGAFKRHHEWERISRR